MHIPWSIHPNSVSFPRFFQFTNRLVYLNDFSLFRTLPLCVNLLLLHLLPWYWRPYAKACKSWYYVDVYLFKHSNSLVNCSETVGSWIHLGLFGLIISNLAMVFLPPHPDAVLKHISEAELFHEVLANIRSKNRTSVSSRPGIWWRLCLARECGVVSM